MLLRLLRRELSRPDELPDERVVGCELLEDSVAEPVGAGVADVTDRDLPGLLVDEQRGDHGSHACGQRIFERVLVDPVVRRLARSVLKPIGETKKAESFDAKVLKSFVADDGALKSIPASRKKRTIVLRWLMHDFVGGRRYREAEVNEAIQRHHWDSATLRRELVGHRMLARKDRVYWRLPESEWQDGGKA